jgi:4-diphosphocytidyl-2-C-methyl-D-erythritol kinase
MAGRLMAASEPPPDPSALTEPAQAKVNLFLHVRGRRENGMHELESLAVFPETGDVLSAERSPIRSLSLDGPFAADLGSGDDNIVIRAVEALAGALDADEGVALRLEKRLPVASGIGGGSADAAATLRLLMKLWGRAPDLSALRRIAAELGADVPVCLPSQPAMMGGVGETLAPAPAMPEFWLVLVNPLQAVSTGAVFSALERRENPAAERAPAGFADVGGLVAWLARRRNDLEAPARAIAPVISAALLALRWTPSCRLARMSGSGATCFGIFGSEPEALEAARAITRAEPGWWVTPARVPAWAPESEVDLWDAIVGAPEPI